MHKGRCRVHGARIESTSISLTSVGDCMLNAFAGPEEAADQRNLTS